MNWAGLHRATVDGRAVVVKTTDYDARLEADGLRALAAAGAPVPEVIDVDTHRLTMAWVEGSPEWERLGRTLATVHRSGADHFGYSIDNVIGPLRQPNAWTGRWGSFFALNRVAVHLDDPSIPGEIAMRLRVACDGPLVELLEEHRPTPSLVHGDLWAGNVVDGCWLIDPAVSYSDREVELAFMALFGGIPEAMWMGYLEAWPLADGWERRRPALQLHHLLVHVRLFGGAYVGMVKERLEQLGW